MHFVKYRTMYLDSLILNQKGSHTFFATTSPAAHHFSPLSLGRCLFKGGASGAAFDSIAINGRTAENELVLAAAATSAATASPVGWRSGGRAFNGMIGGVTVIIIGIVEDNCSAKA